MHNLPSTQNDVCCALYDEARISASRNYLGDKYDQHQPLDYYLKGKEKLWFIHPKTKRDLEGLLRILNDHGEEVLISYIKNVYLKKDKALERV